MPVMGRGALKHGVLPLTTETRYQAEMEVRSPPTHKTSHTFYPGELPKGPFRGQDIGPTFRAGTPTMALIIDSV